MTASAFARLDLADNNRAYVSTIMLRHSRGADGPNADEMPVAGTPESSSGTV
jgi:hypothetical protein